MQRKQAEDTVRASFRRKYCTPITEVTICDNVNLPCFCLLFLLWWFLRAIKCRRPEHVFMINLRSGSIFVSLWKLHSGGQGETNRSNWAWSQVNLWFDQQPFFFWRTFCPTFGINWTKRIYSLSNLLLWIICIRFIVLLKKSATRLLYPSTRSRAPQDLPWIQWVNQAVFELQNCRKTVASLIFIYSDRRKLRREYQEWRLRVRLDWDLQPRFCLGPISRGQGHNVNLAVPLRPRWFRDQDRQFSDS